MGIDSPLQCKAYTETEILIPRIFQVVRGPALRINSIFIETDYFNCISYANHDAELRKDFTQMIFKFYDTFFPGITIHSEGWVSVDELKSIYDNVLVSKADETDDNWNELKVHILI